MKLIKDLSSNYPDCIVTHFNFDKHIAKYIADQDTTLTIGYNCTWNDKVLDFIKDYPRRIHFNGEHPCTFTQETKLGLHGLDRGNLFTDIYTICPYTAEWANNKYHSGKNKFKPIIFPIDEENVLKYDPDIKEYDSIFYGSVCGRTHENIINNISRFKYNFTTLGRQHWYPNKSVDVAALAEKITHRNITTFQKWEILSKTRTVPIVNHLFLHDAHIKHIKSYDDWQSNKAFSHLDDNIACQLKPRITEAAFFKMLMLVKRDPWNAIELFFEPGKEFLYYTEETELPSMIEDANKNWDKYKPIVDAAYTKAMENYTTEKVLDRMMRETR